MLKNSEKIDFYDKETLLSTLKSDGVPVTSGIMKAATAGDSSVCFFLGENYLDMNEHKKSLSWFMLGAWQNHSQCMFMVGGSYETGIYVAKNMDIAMDWYIKSISKNYHQQTVCHMDLLCEEGAYSKLTTKMLKVLAQKVEKDKKRIDEFYIFMHLRTTEVKERAKRLNDLIGGSIASASLIEKLFKEEEIQSYIKEQEQIINEFNHLLEQNKRVNHDLDQIVLYEKIIQTLADFV